MYKTSMESPIGKLWIVAGEEGICRIVFGKEPQEKMEAKTTDLLVQCMIQLDEYFSGKRREFDIPLVPDSTPFQRRVYDRLLAIPYGQTQSYKDIAIAVGSPKGMRAVGGANNKNPIPIIIPCHRVIGADGRLIGYGGGVSIKKWLLDHEKAHKDHS
ncbi:methylated-DNA--[protein]-cysteine S-methyltransferase [Alkalibacter rhizosphaerae]|uniref:Methylated-DNA--protein-cysteine methyltransferase n=1 Tax=Alkalibacter rhizosphaerae TaxID=2815577 RepID=A0A974XGQ0_9FIRM|nr:methylated-DNA--[protein]-cysteine S-methyltransferase [Alkalibacter rhizosphaerae]QSX07998.1 methylated-DNA--[protein]-cysteine S-methyltransferase [Alkalibacter rhizosphaerae]